MKDVGTALVPMRNRDAWLEVDLTAIIQNLEVIAALAGPSVMLAPAVKADAYGHGLAPVAQALDGHVEALCVATLDEGIALRQAGVTGRVVVLYPVPHRTMPDAAAVGLELTLMSEGDVNAAISTAARMAKSNVPLSVHIAVETGFHRGGMRSDQGISNAGRVDKAPGIRLASVWSHLASPEIAEHALAQVAAFERIRADLTRVGIDTPGHIAASGGIFMQQAADLPMVRPGLALYGELDPALPLSPAATEAAARLRPAMVLKARPVSMSDVGPGHRVGYGGTWQASRASRVATLPVGYADGFARASQPGGEVLVRGRRVPIVGIVSMDSIGIDVTDVPEAGLDDEFVLLGSQGHERISATDLARQRTTIAWEVLTSMAPRLDRVYHRSAELTPSGSGP